MNTKSLMLSVGLIALSAGFLIGCAGSKGSCSMCSMHSTKSVSDKVDAQLVKVGNTVCPVSGNKVGEMGPAVPYEYNGKIYNLCCSMCIKDFKADPEKYSKIAEEQAIGK